jgi:YegS/Rv2252/BmrU family lipid kinase
MYELLVTHERGDATRHAQNAVANGVSMVAVYGGDGTVIETAVGLAGSQIPMAILPGGTANMTSKAYNISQNFAEACALMVGDKVGIQPVNLGMINGQAFLQLAGIGLEAKMIEGADREAKDRLGMLAYGLSALQALGDAKVSHYHLEMDGQVVDVDGVTCLIALVENLGMSSLAKALDAGSHPGKFDVIVLQRADLTGFMALLPSLVSGAPPNHESIQHWHAREVKVTADPPQTVQADGEMLGKTPVTAHIIPNAVNIIVPRSTAPATVKVQPAEVKEPGTESSPATIEKPATGSSSAAATTQPAPGEQSGSEDNPAEGEQTGSKGSPAGDSD